MRPFVFPIVIIFMISSLTCEIDDYIGPFSCICISIGVGPLLGASRAVVGHVCVWSVFLLTPLLWSCLPVGLTA